MRSCISISSLHVSVSSWMLSLAYSIKWLFHSQPVINHVCSLHVFSSCLIFFSCSNSLFTNIYAGQNCRPFQFSFPLPYLVCSCSLQSRCRCYLVRSRYVRLVKATITAQCGWRRRVARKELRNLKMVRNPLFQHCWTSFYVCVPLPLVSSSMSWSSTEVSQ